MTAAPRLAVLLAIAGAALPSHGQGVHPAANARGAINDAPALLPGDLLVNGSASAGTGVLRVDESTGALTLIAEGVFSDFAVTATGVVYATTNDSVVRVDPAAGTRETLTSGLVNAVGIAVSVDEEIFVTVRGEGPVLETGAVLRIEPEGGQSIVAHGGYMGSDPGSGADLYVTLADTEIGPDGQLVVLDVTAQPNTGELYTVDPVSGAQSLVPVALEVTDPTGVSVTSDGTLLLSQLGVGLGIGDVHVDPLTGDASLLVGDTNPQVGGPDTWATLEAGLDAGGSLLRAKVSAAPTGLVRFLGGGDQEWVVLAPGVFDEIQRVPPPEGCGDGESLEPEECDDGNGLAGDGCSHVCLVESCGNERVDFGEQCEDANTLSGDGCDANCSLTACGNDVATEGEECDDGNLDSSDGCDANCTLTGCGNGVVTEGEACDDADAVDDNGCNRRCGVDFGEQTKRQRRCIQGVHRGLDRLAGIRAQENERCLSDAAAGRLGTDPAAFDLCLAADASRKRARAERSLADFERDACTAKAPELALGTALLAGMPAASGLPSELARDLFGSPASAASSNDGPGASCQARVLRGANELFAAVWAELLDASGDKLAGRGTAAAVNDGQLSTHVSQVLAGSRSIGKAAAELQERTARACGALGSVMALFPGCQAADATALGACAEHSARCRACLLVLEGAPGIALDCELFDDGSDDASCPTSR